MKSFLIILTLVVATGTTVYFVERRNYIRGEGIRRVMDSVKRTRELDSLRLIMETRFRDSLKTYVRPLVENDRVLQRDLKKLRNENTYTQKRYDSVSVSMPEF